jgi:hypothetical protein
MLSRACSPLLAAVARRPPLVRLAQMLAGAPPCEADAALRLAADAASPEPDLVQTKDALRDEHEQLLKPIPTNIET